MTKRYSEAAIPQLSTLLLVSVMFSGVSLTVVHGEEPKSSSRLIEELASQDHTIRKNARKELANRGATVVGDLAMALKSADASTRVEVADILRKIGPEALPAQGALLVALSDPDENVSVAAAHALWYIGPTQEATTKLIEALNHSNAHVRGFAARALGKIGPAAHEAVPLVMAMLADPDDTARRNAAFALPEMHPHQDQLVRDLFKHLKEDEDYDNEDFRTACQHAGKDSVAFLEQSLEDSTPRIRRMAIQVLGSMRDSAKSALPALVRSLKDEDPSVRRRAIFALCDIGPESHEALQAVIQTLESDDPDVRRSVICAIGKMGSNASTAVSILIRALKDEDVGVRIQAAGTFWMIEPDIQVAVPALIGALSDPDGNVRSQAAWSLDNLGADRVLPYLIEALKVEQGSNYGQVAKVIGDFESEATPAIPALVRVLGDSRRYVTDEVVDALCKIGGAATVTALQEILRDEDKDTRIQALRILGRLGAEAASAAPSVKDCLLVYMGNIQELSTAQAAANTLDRIGVDATEILIAALKDAQPTVRSRAAWLLGGRGEQAAKAIPAIEGLLKDSDEHVRETAAAVLERIRK